tara:strand:- start:36 stop:332 length:297 start_codon:yes stop_codon:yes gene_type:complete
MKQSINFYDFRQAFRQHERDNQFSHEGLSTLFDMLEDYEQDTDEEIELDVIALCCDFTEYDSFKELTDNYDCIESEDDLTDWTWWRKTQTNSYIIHNF